MRIYRWRCRICGYEGEAENIEGEAKQKRDNHEKACAFMHEEKRKKMLPQPQKQMDNFEEVWI